MNKPMGIESAIKDTKDLREFLTQQMANVANGRFDSDRCKGISNLAQQIYNSLNIEVKMAVARSKMKEGDKIEPVKFSD